MPGGEPNPTPTARTGQPPTPRLTSPSRRVRRPKVLGFPGRRARWGWTVARWSALADANRHRHPRGSRRRARPPSSPRRTSTSSPRNGRFARARPAGSRSARRLGGAGGLGALRRRSAAAGLSPAHAARLPPGAWPRCISHPAASDGAWDVLLTDAPGRWFSQWALYEEAPAAEGARWIARNADAFLVFADSGEDAWLEREGLNEPRCGSSSNVSATTSALARRRWCGRSTSRPHPSVSAPPSRPRSPHTSPMPPTARRRTPRLRASCARWSRRSAPRGRRRLRAA